MARMKTVAENGQPVKVGDQVRVVHSYGLGSSFEFVGTIEYINPLGTWINVRSADGSWGQYPQVAIKERLGASAPPVCR